MGLKFADHPDVVYDRAPLTTVLSVIRFPPVLSLMTQVGLTGFQTVLRDEYPALLPPERTAAVAVTPESLGVQATAPTWKLTDDSRRWTVGIGVDFVSIETTLYAGIDGFLSRFSRVLAAVHTTVRPADSLRIGFRKVNAIDLPEPAVVTSLSGIVRPEILGPLAKEDFPAGIFGSFSQLQFAVDYSTFMVRYGLSAEPPSESPTHFVMDLDFYTEQPYAIEPGDDLLGLLRFYSESETSFFHWAFASEYLQTLGPQPRTEGAKG